MFHRLSCVISLGMTACATNIVLGWAFRLFYSDDGYVWTAYNSPLSDAVLGEVLTAESETTNIEFDPPIQVKEHFTS